jgi:chaperonin cofactor prefoldin
MMIGNLADDAMSEVVDLTALFTICERTLDETRAMRRELRDVREFAIRGVDYTRRLERRIEELKDDLEVLIKGEIGGRLAHLQTELENDIAHQVGDQLRGSKSDAVTDLERRLDELARELRQLRDRAGAGEA